MMLAAPAAAQTPDPDPPPAQAPEPAPPAGDLERPELLEDSPPRYPPEAWKEQLEADVVVLLTLDVEGGVTEAELVTPAGHGFDEEALHAAHKLRFTPARVGGVPTAVKIRYTFRFRVPEKQTVTTGPTKTCEAEACPTDERKTSRLIIHVYERGKGKKLPGIEVYVLDQDRVVLTDENGIAEIEGPPGAYGITIRPPGYYPFEKVERLEEGERLEVNYYVRRHRRGRYSTIVWGSEGSEQVARTSLVDDEIRSIPGTMGDPIRVAMLLPGVIASASGLGYPIIRGSLPGDSMYEIDGIQVPMLYHLLFGTAVIHPRFVDEISFQPGGYSAEHGRFPGGRIAATTAKVEDPIWVADLSIVETSLLRSQPVGDSSEVVLAARYGTLGYIVEGLAADVTFRYWDYQGRFGHRFGNGGKLTFTVLGAQDAAGGFDEETDEERLLRVGFHKLDLRYRQAVGNGWFQGGVQLGLEFFRPPPEDNNDDEAPPPPDADQSNARPYIEGGYTLSSSLELRAGGDVLLQDFGLELESDEDVFLISPDTGVTLGAWTSAKIDIGKLVISPSVRIDHYRYNADAGDARETSVDPRVAVSYELSKKNKTVVKASAGIHSGPPRFSFVEPPIVFGPIPGFEGPGLYKGLSNTKQYQAGVETKLPYDLDLMASGFYHDNHMPVDFSLIDKDLRPDPTPCDGEDTPVLVHTGEVDGRSYGAELMLRRRLGNAFFGWVSYSWARSERTVPGVGTFPFDFDQTHVLNTALSWEVGRNWTLGTVFHLNTGRPYTPDVVDNCGGFFEGRRGELNAARLPAYWRVDFRMQKREVFDTWYFDFYIDAFNAAFQWEVVGYDVDGRDGSLVEQNVPLFLPMIGIRGEF